MRRSKQHYTPTSAHPDHTHINRLLPFTTAPLFHTLSLMATGDAARFHMPGHKGQPLFSTFDEVFAIDFTEIPGTGNLYEGVGPIRDAEVAAARYFGAADCFFLTGGSSQGVMTMLASAVRPSGAVLLDRGCHKSVCHACALLGLTPYFVQATLLAPFGVAGALSLSDIEGQLTQHPEIDAFLLTSPTYYGVRQDLPAIAALCHRYGKRLLVDAAHGAHFTAVDLPGPIAQGADLAVLSAHKTLPCLGQGAVLLLGAGIDRPRTRENTALFGTSSPSYPIMASIDLARAYLEGPGAAAYRRAAESCRSVRRLVNRRTRFAALDEQTYPLLDPCRLTVCTAGSDFSGWQLADALRSEFGVYAEMADAYNVVFILTSADTGSALRRLRHGLRRISARREHTIYPVSAPAFPPAERVMSVRQAWFSQTAHLPAARSEGCICARPVTPYPPGIPLLWPGEKITAEHIASLQEKWYNDLDDICIVVPENPTERGLSR